MAIKEVLAPAGKLFGGTFSRLLHYWWVLFIFVGIAAAIFIVFLIKLWKDKNAQWTHTLKVRRVLKNNLLSDPIIMRMRRFPLIKRAEVFELEKPLLGGYLLPELEEYSNVNEYSIILDKNNRIYTNKGEYFVPDKASVNVSAKHSEIDISRSDLRADYQNINTISKRVEWATIAKYAMLSLLIIAVMLVCIVGIGKWGDAQDSKARSDEAQAQAMANLAKALETSEATTNTQSLIIDKLQELYDTKNINQVVRKSINDTTE